MVLLEGLGISGYRSFGPEMVFIPELAKVNLFVGKNNSGKSNILRFCIHLFELIEKQQTTFNRELDYCVKPPVDEVSYAFLFRQGSAISGENYATIANVILYQPHRFPEWEKEIWVQHSATHPKDVSRSKSFRELVVKLTERIDANASNQMASKVLRYTGGEHQQRVTDIAKWLQSLRATSFQVSYIDAFRRIGSQNIAVEGKSKSYGSALITGLRNLQNPQIGVYAKNKEKFQKINEFLRQVLLDPDAALEIPAETDDLYVNLGGKVLPLESLGTGIHQTIMLAAAVTVEEGKVFCIEEPEVHLHPALLKRLMRYLFEKTSNQYLIASHSNACFDLPWVNIYHCRLENGLTRCELIKTEREHWDILSDLGYKASDLLQTNYVIWVEGPSDRIYLNHWIATKDPSLREGFHYNIIFYGGRLLCHLGFDSVDVGEFINLARVNRNAAILIDSDKSTQNDELNQTKQRVIAEFEKASCFVWVTQGKEIENYISKSLLSDCVSKVCPKVVAPVRWGQYTSLTKLDNDKTVDKIKLAKEVSNSVPDYEVLDLGPQIDGLVAKIREANE